MLRISYFEHIVLRHESPEKVIKLGRVKRKRRGQPTARRIHSVATVITEPLEDLNEQVKDRSS